MLQEFKNQLGAYIVLEHNVIRFSRLQVIIPTSYSYFLFVSVKMSTGQLRSSEKEAEDLICNKTEGNIGKSNLMLLHEDVLFRTCWSGILPGLLSCSSDQCSE